MRLMSKYDSLCFFLRCEIPFVYPSDSPVAGLWQVDPAPCSNHDGPIAYLPDRPLHAVRRDGAYFTLAPDQFRTG